MKLFKQFSIGLKLYCSLELAMTISVDVISLIQRSIYCNRFADIMMVQYNVLLALPLILRYSSSRVLRIGEITVEVQIIWLFICRRLHYENSRRMATSSGHA
jgi:hypothetical protein